jgi:cytochrome c556
MLRSLLLIAVLAAPPTTREAMKKLNGGPNSIHQSLKKDLQDPDPDWEGIQESAADYVKLTADLGKNKPTMGEVASWERLSKDYHDGAKALDAAAKRKDKRGTSAALTRLGNACTTCHKSHRKE